jgi:group I intron endonuclease
LKIGNLQVYGIIYKITNKINNKVYIGQTTKSFNERYQNDIGKNTHNQHLKNSIKKYGIKNFRISKQFDVAYSKEELDDLEDTYITIYNTLNRQYGYNKQTGGSNGKMSVESRNKLSNSKKGKYTSSKNPNAKKIICLNTKEIFSSATDICKEKGIKDPSNIIAVCKNKRHSTHGLVFMYYKEYTNLNLKDIDDKLNYINKNKSVYNHKAKKIICITTNEIFGTITEATNKYNINHGDIIRVCHNKRNYCGKHPITKKQLKWMYYDDYIKLYKEAI